MINIRKTEHYRQIETVYPSDVAMIIAICLLEKSEKYKKLWTHNYDCLYISTIDRKIIISGLGKCETYDIDGNIVENNITNIYDESHLVEDDKQIYVMDRKKRCMTICNKLTRNQKSISRNEFGNPSWTAVMSHIHITNYFGNSVCEYTENGEFVSEWNTVKYPTIIKSYEG